MSESNMPLFDGSINTEERIFKERRATWLELFFDLAKHATIINFARATVFTVPFVYIGAQYWGVPGILIGQAIGSIIIGIIAFLFSLRVVKKMKMTRDV